MLPRLFRTCQNFLAPAQGPQPYVLDVLTLEDRILFSATPLLLDPAAADAGGADAGSAADLLTLENLAAQAVANMPLDAGANSVGANDVAALPDVSDVSHELVFVDRTLDHVDTLLHDLLDHAAADRQFEVVYLDHQKDGFAQVDAALAGDTHFDAIHFLTHGEAGSIQLGGSTLDRGTVEQHLDQIEHWSDSLTDDADLLFYACDAAGNADGQLLLARLSDVTGADAAASNDLTGSTALGGDWDLEVHFGAIETAGLSATDGAQWQGLLAVYTVTNTDDSGAGSFRQALLDANANVGADTIDFNIAGTGTHVIVPLTPLPSITDAVVVDAMTQPGYAGTPLIEIDCSSAAGATACLLLDGSDITVRGFSFYGSADDGLEIAGNVLAGDNNVLEYNWIGLRADGSVAGNSDVGILLTSGAAGNTLRNNVIAGNTSYGIQIRNSGTDNNVVVGNIIGLNATGTAVIANGGPGIQIYDYASNNRIGGSGAERNVISGNNSYGVQLFSNVSNNLVQGNYIGTDITGTVDLGNVLDGIRIEAAANNITISGNTIAGNGGAGIRINASNDTAIHGNFIGTDHTGQVDLGNSAAGVQVENGALNTSVGGTTNGTGNTISGNDGYGVYVNGATITGTTIRGNAIGMNFATSVAIGNMLDGIRIEAAAGTLIGEANGNPVGGGNVVSGNSGYGLALVGGANGTSVIGNNFGVDANGAVVFANGQGGVLIDSSYSNTIGGTNAGEGNIISGNIGNGITITGVGATGNAIQGNRIGVDATGEIDLGNSGNGIDITAGGNLIGGATASARNIISGNGLRGIYVTGSGVTTTIQNNYVGTDDDGLQVIGNSFDGIEINFGAGDSVIQNNLVAGNGQWSIIVTGGGSGNSITGNTVGLNATQDGVLGGAGIGLYNGGNNVVGNVIGGTSNYGLYLSDSANNVIQGNYIGTNAALASGLGCAYQGIGITGAASLGNLIGGIVLGQGNVIAYNGFDGIALTSNVGTGNAILGNRIFANSHLGIDLHDNGVTTNDAGDVDAGANGLQNFPVLVTATTNANNQLIITGTFNSAANSNYRIEFFANTSQDGTGYGEGQTYLGFANVATDGSGNATISITFTANVAAGTFISATATQATDGSYSSFTNTSEFARNIATVDSTQATVIVTTTSDTSDGDTTSLSTLIANKGADGFISLREAIAAANNTANGSGGADRIYFAIGTGDAGYDVGRGVFTLSVASALPAVTDAVIIDATTQAANIGNTNAGTLGSGGTVGVDGVALATVQRPEIELADAGGVATGLNFTSGAAGSQLLGMAVWGFDNENVYVDAANMRIEGNVIGTRADSFTDLGAGLRTAGAGISIHAAGGTLINNLIGYVGHSAVEQTTTAATGWTIQGNELAGASLLDSAYDVLNVQGANTVVSGNLFRDSPSSGIDFWIDAAGSIFTNNTVTGLNGSEGHALAVWLGADGVTISRNIIANNPGGGVVIDTGSNTILSNQIYNNSGLGIDLGRDGVTANDAGDTDSGPNGLQNFPVLATARTNASNQLTLTGTFNSTANSYYRIEFFANTSQDGTGHGEGQTYLGFANVATDGSGNATISTTFTANVAQGTFISATATRATDVTYTAFTNTSEFAANIAAVAMAPQDLVMIPGVAAGNVIGYYGFSDSSALGRDDAVGATMTLSGSPSQTAGLDGSGAIDLAGGASGQYGEIVGITTGGAMTISASVRFDTTGAWQRVFDFGENLSTGVGNIYVGRLASSNDLTFTIERDLGGGNLVTYRANALGAITNGQWLTFTATVDAGGQMSLYVNGALAATQAGFAPDVAVRSHNYVGKSNWPGDVAFDGAIDNLFVAQGALSAAQVAALVQQTGGLVVPESSATGTVVGTVVGLDGDAAHTLTFSLTDSAGGRFAIDATTGTVTVANGSLLDFETATSHSITVRSTNNEGLWRDESWTISIADANDAPNDIALNHPAATNLLTNGSFEANTGIDGTASNGTVTGWTAVGPDGFEIWKNFDQGGPGTASDGNSLLEMDVAGGVSGISQTVNTVANQTYILSFDLSNRAPEPNSVLEVYWRNELVGTITQATVGWQTYNLVVTGSGGADTLVFMETNAANSGVGELLDNVRLTAEQSPAISVAENAGNGTVVATAAGADINQAIGDTLTYSLTDSASGTFAIDSTTGIITVADGSQLNYESGATRSITVRVTDGSGLTYDENFTIQVANVNEAITAVADSVTAAEAGGTNNGTPGTDPTGNVLTNDTDIDSGDTKTVVGVAAGTGANPSGSVGTNVVGNYGTINIAADGSYTYTVDNNNSAVQALQSPLNTLSEVFTYTVQDSGGLTSYAQVTVTIQGANDSPVISSNGGGATANISVAEGTSAVTTVVASDIDQSPTLTYSIAGGVDAVRFNIDANTGALTFVVSPDYEVPVDFGGDNIYDVTVRVSDGNGGFDTQAIAVTVTAVNDNAPVITSNGGGATANISVAENNTTATTVTATDADLPAQTLTYSIAGGVDAVRFNIDANTGALTFVAAPDYEAPVDVGGDNIYNVAVQVSDGNGSFDTQAIAVTVTNTNDNAPVITSNGGGATANVSVAENSTTATTFTATDADLPAQTLTYSITGGVDATRFSIDANTGVLTFVAAPDYEAPVDFGGDNIYDVTVQVSDGNGGIDTQAIAVTVTNVNDNAPVINSNGGGATANISIAENNTTATTVTATDADLPAQTLTYSITGGVDATRFSIDANTGVLTFVAAPDYEAPVDVGGDNIYNVTVQVSDGNGNTDTQAIAITVTNLNDNAPVITSNGGGATANVNIAENSTTATTVIATDADLPAQTLTYSITGGVDATRFSIDANTGVLTFVAAPDYEAPVDFGGDNIYDVTVQVSDGNGGIDTQSLAITVTAQNDNSPVIVTDGGGGSASISVTENNSALTTVTATDADLPSQTLTYSILGGADAARFQIDANTGVLTFVAAPNFEAPTDVGGDNTYNVTVQVSDGNGGFDTQSITVTILDTNEAPQGTSNIRSTNEDTPLVLAISDFGFTDADAGDGLRAVQINSFSSAGSLTLAGVAVTNGQIIDIADIQAGNLRFTPLPNDNGAGYAALNFTVQDQAGLWGATSNVLTINVSSVNDIPVANPESFSIFTGEGLIFSAPGILGNDSDLEGSSLTAVLVQGPAHGTLTLNSDGSFLYLGDPTFFGTVTFVYQCSDGSAVSTPTTVEITISPFASGGVDGGNGGGSSSGGNSTGDNGQDNNDNNNGGGGVITIIPGIPTDPNQDNKPRAVVVVVAPDTSTQQTPVSIGTAVVEEPKARQLSNGLEMAAVNFARVTQAIVRSVDDRQRIDIAGLTSAHDVQALNLLLNTLRNEMLEQREFREVATTTATAATAALSAGYALWTLKSGHLLASLLTGMPAWKHLDPLAVVNSSRSAGDEDDESLADIAGQAN